MSDVKDHDSELPEVATPADVARYLNVAPGTLANDRSRGRGPAFVKVGNRVRYLRSDVLDYLAANRTTPASA
ncbi:MAG: helix-turn-helix domain-containing protein [Gordonia sp. (in: high G+C Gram-positive bacteria)]